MKITREDKFVPINIRIETRQEADFLLAVFNRAPSVMAEALENNFTAQEILDILGRTNNQSKSAWNQLNDVLYPEGR